MLLYDSLNLIISGVHQSHRGSWGYRSEIVKLRGLDYVAYVAGEVFKNPPCVSRQQTPIIPDLGIKPEKKLTFLG